MPLLDRIQLDRPVTAEDFNRLQTNIERALKKLQAGTSSNSLRIINTILGSLTGGLSYDLGNNILGNNTGTEGVVWQRRVQTGIAGAPLTLVLLCDGRSQTGTSYARLRLGGGDRTVDGTIVATMTIPVSGAGYNAQIATVTVASPGGMQHLKLTTQSSAAGQLAQVKDGCVVLQ